MHTAELPPFVVPGAEWSDAGVAYTVWAPRRESVAVVVLDDAGAVRRRLSLAREEDGYFRGTDAEGRPGNLYQYELDGGDAFPDPASRSQPQGVHGPSQVVTAHGYEWRATEWQRPAFRELIIYELHLGTFSPEGTFRGAIAKLPYLRDLGINAIEIMPVADFPGERGWGYDGVQLFAPARAYGTPDDFRALIDEAHAHGLAVILDVVYNHFGPDGNYITQFSSAYFSAEDKTPWGNAVNFGHELSQPVRDFYRANVFYWLRDFHLDGFRLDATHAIIDASDRHIMAELAEIVHEHGGYIIAEDERNEAQLVASPENGGFGFDGVWADDFHHIVEVGLIEASVYRHDFDGDLKELLAALRQGWFYCGQNTRKRGTPRGTVCEAILPERFVFCISNHDQVGNRAFGERLNHLVEPAAYRAASALLLLAPSTPLLFQGQEWSSSSPFQYFTDHNEELGRLIEQGRREEFRDAFENSAPLGEVPAPQAASTFQDSKLRWNEIEQPGHAAMLALYRELIRLRRAHEAFRPRERGVVKFSTLGDVLAMQAGDFLVLCDLAGGHECALPEGRRWRLLLSTNEPRFGGAKAGLIEGEKVRLPEPEVLVLQAMVPYT